MSQLSLFAHIAACMQAMPEHYAYVNIIFSFPVEGIVASNKFFFLTSVQVLGTDELNAYLGKYRIVLDPQLEALIGR